jgi:hypothetical protein
MRRTGLICAAAVVLAANIFALIRVAGNRAGSPLATIELTERELPLQNLDPDNSGAVVRLAWSEPAPFPNPTLARQDMEAAGFDFAFPPGTRREDIGLLSREAYVALEYQGRLWEQAVEQAKSAPKGSELPAARTQPGPSRPVVDPQFASRLYVAGASSDPEDLRRRFPDPTRYLIVRALLRARIDEVKDPQTDQVTSLEFGGYVGEVLPSMIFVPLPHGKLLASLPQKTGHAPRYAITLRYGRSYEPWVESVKVY